jgi:hypothetical protein
MLFTLLAFWHNVSVYLAGVWDETKTKLRSWLGPEPMNYYLLQDGRVLPSLINLPPSLAATTHLFNPRNHRMTALNSEPDARHRRLNVIAANFSHPDTGNIDISDWVGEIRAHPVPELSIRQLLSLWSLTHNRFVPFSGGTQVSVTKNDGETDLITLE